jgi:hypothetical protein
MRLMPSLCRPVCGLLLFVAGCSPKLPAAKAPRYREAFDGPALSSDWHSTAGPGIFRLEGGALTVRGAHNHPLWLTQALPRDVVVELDAWADSPDGDIKVELFGDGKSYAQSLEYTSTGYVLIHGGWHNQLSALCRQEEHGADRKTRPDLRVVPGQHYHYAIARHGQRVEWFIDGQLALDLVDPAPLEGPQHSYFAFDNWESSIHFDNLVVRPY